MNPTEVTIYKYVGNLTSLTIPQTYDNLPVTEIQTGAFLTFLVSFQL